MVHVMVIQYMHAMFNDEIIVAIVSISSDVV